MNGMNRLLAAATAALAVLLTVGGPSLAATSVTVISHGDTSTNYYPDDICGARASWVTATVRATAFHLTQNGDSYTSHYTETGTYHVDFVDPSLADQDSQFTGASTILLTVGQTLVVSSTWHDFPTGLRIWEQYHLTLVDGQPVIERYVLKVTGCP
jgi:hypothetical protein